MKQRLDYQYLARWIDPDTRVLDLGCETGDLLRYLRDKRNIRGIGIDNDNDHLTECLAHRLQVIYTDIREGLSMFSGQTFDYVILSQTLQAINRPPQHLLSEMLRVGRAAIVSFPNFAHYSLRWQLAAGGRMPGNQALPYAWHNTPNVRYCTIKDFEHWCAEQRFIVNGRIFLGRNGEISALPNLLAETALYRLTRAP